MTHTVASLAEQLADLGVRAGETLLVQSSLRAVGSLDGGPTALLKALLGVLGPAGTLVVYTATPENSDTSRLALARTAGLSPAELRAHRATMPPFDPATTRASPILGWFPEEVRRHPGALRSGHPQTSFTALGPAADALLSRHPLDSHLGPGSPVQRLYDGSARALLIGVPLWCCTAFHLAEYRQPRPPRQTYGCVLTDRRGLRQWVHFDAVALRDDHFPPMEPVLAAGIRPLHTGPLGAATCHLFDIRAGVDVATEFLRTWRPATCASDS